MPSSGRRLKEGRRQQAIAFSRLSPRVALIALSLLSLSLAWVGPVAAAEGDRFVSPTGSDAGTGSSLYPWRTIRHALGQIRAGDVLYVRGGTYVEDVSRVALAKGTPSERITVTAYPGERPIIKGLLWLNEPNYWTIDGIDVTWDDANPPSAHMVRMVDGVGWVLKNSEIWGARSYAGLLVAGTLPGQPSAWRVSGNCVHDTYPSNGTNQDHNIYVNTGTGDSGVLRRNIVFNASNGSNIKLGPPSTWAGGPSDVIVRYNTMFNAVTNLGVHWTAYNNVFRHNLLGRTESGYGNFYSYQLSGPFNVAHDNAGFDAGAGRLITGDDGFGRVSDDSGNQYPLDPDFDSVGSCAGFRPQEPSAQGYGAHAPSVVPSPDDR